MRRGRKNNKEKSFIDYEGRIKKCRDEYMDGIGITQTELAKKLYVSKATINNYEHQKPYSMDIARSLASFFNIDVRYFTYEINHRNYKEAMEYLKEKQKEELCKLEALSQWLLANGYKLEQTNYCLEAYSAIMTDTPNNSEQDNNIIENILHPNKEVYILTRPDGTKGYFTEENKNLFIDIMLSTLNRLILPFRE